MKVTIEGEIRYNPESRLSVWLKNAFMSKGTCKLRLKFPEGTFHADLLVTNGESYIRHDGDHGAYEFQLLSCRPLSIKERP